MERIPVGIRRIVPSTTLRKGMDELEKLASDGAFGLQKWSKAVSLIVVSRAEWDELQKRAKA